MINNDEYNDLVCNHLIAIVKSEQLIAKKENRKVSLDQLVDDLINYLTKNYDKTSI